MSGRILPAVLAVLICSTVSVGRAAGPARPALPPPAAPLKTVDTVRLPGEALFAHAMPVVCDQEANLYFRVAPHYSLREDEEARKAGRLLSYDMHEVVRIDADRKKRISFTLAGTPALAGAKAFNIAAMAVGKDGSVFLVVWARWSGTGDQAERGRQLILSFSPKGEYQSQIDADWQELLVRRFEVFGTGEFLLTGARPTGEPRTAILSAAGRLRDVIGWVGQPSENPDENPSTAPNLQIEHMARGRDGRIYAVEQDAIRGSVVLYAFRPSGESEPVFELRGMPQDRRLAGFRWSGSRFAVIYSEAGEPQGSGRWWIAVSTEGGDGEPESTYGPTAQPPVCYERTASGDRFTFLPDGTNLVTMAPN